MTKKLLIQFGKGILAGLSIGLGGFLYILMTAYVPGELGKILGSLLFAVGLFLVCTFRFSLYTGKIGVVFEGKQTKEFYWSLPVMIIGNLIGAFALGLLCHLIFQNTALNDSVLSAVNSRLSLTCFNDYLSLIFKSFLCGTCVYLAVKAFNLNRLKPVGIILLVFFVFLFVYCGFQHCIANMFYFGFAFQYSGLIFANMALCILFNSFGPIIGILLFKIFNSNK